MIDIKTAQWLDNPEMKRYLRPETLFAVKHFESYLSENSISLPASSDNLEARVKNALKELREFTAQGTIDTGKMESFIQHLCKKHKVPKEELTND